MPETRNAKTLAAVVDRYCEAWGVADDAARRALLASVWAPDATYTDPTAHVQGIDGLATHIAGVRQQYPGAIIERTSTVDSHHDHARFGWQLRRPDGSTLPEGIDIVDFTADGRIAAIVGFFGPLRRG
ncbi:MAG: nuclear transport factor 2 family protein [Burkholderiales bacterium]